MDLKEKLMRELKDAMKSADKIKKQTITMVRAAILQIEKDKKVVLDDKGVIDVISSEMKKRTNKLKSYYIMHSVSLKKPVART